MSAFAFRCLTRIDSCKSQSFKANWMHIPLLRILGPSLVVTLIRHLEVGDQVEMEVVVVGEVRNRWSWEMVS